MNSRNVFHRSWRAWSSHDYEPVGPAWLRWAWTVAFSAGIALLFTLLGLAFAADKSAWLAPRQWWQAYRGNLWVSMVIGGLIQLAFDAGRWLLGAQRIRRFNGVQRVAFFAGIPTVAASAGWPLAVMMQGLDPSSLLRGGLSSTLMTSVLASMAITFILYQFFEVKNRQIDAERRAAQAQLKLLQGQIEPHFLFNTLANVVGLMESNTPRAKLMLESFVDYLRSSLLGLRREHHTLGDELELVDAYLRIVGIRMDDRLRARIDVPDTLRAARLPALIVQPLVENAVVHGLEPQVEGGHVDIRAHEDAHRLVITVEDDGLGLQAAALRPRRGSGSACENIRERLRQAYGGGAALHIENTLPHGVRARLVLPIWTQNRDDCADR